MTWNDHHDDDRDDHHSFVNLNDHHDDDCSNYCVGLSDQVIIMMTLCFHV